MWEYTLRYHTYSSTCIIGIGQVIQHQPCTFENFDFHFHYALHFTSKDIQGLNGPKGNSY